MCDDFPLAGTPKRLAPSGRIGLKEAEIAGAVGNDAFNLGIVLKLKTERLELASYLKGLQFGAPKTGEILSPCLAPGSSKLTDF